MIEGESGALPIDQTDQPAHTSVDELQKQQQQPSSSQQQDKPQSTEKITSKPTVDYKPHHQEEKHEKVPLYPIGPDGKRDFSLSPAQRADPTKVFNSDCTICYRDVSVKVRVTPGETVNNVFTPLTKLYDGAVTCGKSCTRSDFYRVKDISGVIRPGTMTLVLSGPGEGKSTYLRALANRIELSSGRVVYNGRNFDQATKEGVDLTKTVQYVDQLDCHFALLTVDETLDFAHKMSSVSYDRQRVEDIITLLGMEECRDTIIGNQMVRGISGGQKKRVTVGELLLSDASTLFLDEYSNGLDSSTAEDIGKGLSKFCKKYNNSIVATLQQPTPELFALFDRLVVLREGQVVFDGPVEDVVPFFAAMGFNAPDDVDTADFLIDCLSQPRSVILRQQAEEAIRLKKQNKNNNFDTNNDSHHHHHQHHPKNGKQLQTSYGPIQASPTPCITTEEMIDYYQTTPQWKEIEEELDELLPITDLSHGTHHPVDPSKHKPLLPTEASKQMYGLGYRLNLFELIMAVAGRQFKVFIRNVATLRSRIISCIVMSLIYGSLYWKISADNFVLRLAAVTLCVAQMAFSNFVEIPLSATNAYIVKKQLAAKFYPSWSFCISTWVTALPMSIIEGSLASLILYWMTGAYPGAKQFFMYWFLMICVSICLSAWFRCLAIIGGDEATAQALAPPSTGIMMVFGGLFVTRNNLHPATIWLYWLSPMSYSVRGGVNIEFQSPRYNQLIVNSLGENVRIGDVYLNTVDIQVGIQWTYYAYIYLIGLSICITLLNAFLFRSRYYEESRGTRRSTETEILEHDTQVGIENGDTDDELLKAQVTAAAIQQAQIQHIEQSISRDNNNNNNNIGVQHEIVSSQIVSGMMSSNNDSNNPNHGSSTGLQTLRENIPFTPAWLSFSDVSYTVKVKKEKEMVDRVLLNHVNGYAQPGKMLALMGASGAGKTTLLDVIAGLKNTGVVQGNILINGQPTTRELLSNMTGYVEQFDTLFPYQTVQETLLFAARLRLPASVSDNLKIKIVEEIMDILNLTSSRDSIIGNAKIPGLSPAQSKRVNIGLELVANPSILFLDEPTTGLDSKSAQTVMKVVKRIARSGRAIICTIHQPSAELFFLFDRLLLLGSGGYQIYFGDLGHRAQYFVKYLSRCPGITPIQPRVNPASWMLVELGVGVAAEKGDVAARFENIQASADQVEIEDEPEWENLPPQQKTVQKFTKMYLMSNQYEMAMKRINILESIEVIQADDEAGMERHKKEVEMATIKNFKKKSHINPEQSTMTDTSHTALPTTTIVIPPRTRPSLFSQLRLLYVRNFSAYYRNQSVIYYRLAVQTILSLMFGLIYYQVKAVDVASANSLIGAIFMGVQFSTMISTTTGAAIFAGGKVVMIREKAGGYYIPLFWAFCQFAIEAVWTLPSLIITVVITYFMIGLKQDAGTFFSYLFFTYILFMTFISWAMCISSVTPNPAITTIITGVVMSLNQTLSGIAITYPNLPRFWKAIYQVMPLQRVLKALIKPQLRGNDNIMTVVKNGVETKMTVSSYVESYLGWKLSDSIWFELIWIGLFFVVTQLIAWTALTFINFSKR